MNEYGSPLLRAALCALLGTLVAAPLHAQPSISVSPDSLSASLMTGQTETQPLTISNGGTSSLTFAITFPDVGTDSLAYDDGNNTADGFWGWGGGGPGGPEYTCASRFTPTGPFTLTAVRAVVNTFNHLSSVTVEVYGAGTPGIPTSGPLLRTVTVPIQAPYPGRMLDLPLGTSLPFDPGEEFYVVLRFDNELAVPMGGDYLTTERSYVLRWHTNRWEEQQGVTWVLRAVGGSGAWLSADPLTGTVPAGQSLAVDVTFDAMTLLDGTYQQDLVVSSNDPDDPVVVVPATLVVSGEPDIALSVDSLDHGTVFAGAFSERTYEITNIGTDTLVVSTITSSDPAFVPDPAGPFSLEPGHVRVAKVRFAPPAPGVYDATLTLASNDPDEPAETIALQGVGLAPADIAVAPDSLVATLEAGTTGTATLTLSNTGEGPLSFAFAGFNGQAEAAVPAPRAPWPDLVLGKGEPDPRRGTAPLRGSGGPDAFGYRWSDSNEPGGPVFDWVEISANADTLALGDDDFEEVLLPFPFFFYGVAHNAVKVSSNGYLSFDADASDAFNRPIPNDNEPNDLLAAFWDDLDPRGAGDVITGTDSLGRFVVQWRQVARFGTTDRYTFEVVLDPGGSILYQYHTMQGAFLDEATVGIENAVGDDGLEIVFNAPYVHSGLAVRITAAPSWLADVEPPSGSVPPGGSVEVTVTFDATDLAAGTYADALEVLSNDPDEAVLEVPVTLEVTGGLPIALRAGWNLVSWSVDVANPDPAAVLAPLLDRVIAVESYENGERTTYVPARPPGENTLTALMPAYSYWIKLEEAATLVLHGAAVGHQVPLPMVAGLNAVSYLPDRADGIGHALETVLPATSAAMSFPGTGVTYAPGVPTAFHVLHQMEPKAGYFLRTRTPATLVYPAAPGGGTPGEETRPTLAGQLAAERDAGVVPTMEWVGLWGQDVRLDGLPLPLGTRVVALDPAGVVCGAFDVVTQGNVGLMPIYRDDPYTPADEGAGPGDPITLRFGPRTIEGQLQWSAFGDVIDLSGTVVSTEGEDSLPEAYALMPAYPNPFNPSTTIRYALPEAARVRLTVYDGLGRLVATLVDGPRPAGAHAAVWEAGEAASGAYFYRIEAGAFQESRRMLLLR